MIQATGYFENGKIKFSSNIFSFNCSNYENETKFFNKIIKTGSRGIFYNAINVLNWDTRVLLLTADVVQGTF